jgi:Glycoside Hydrolase Family 113
MLKPHLNLSNDPSHWRGQIGESFDTKSKWSQWFASYRAFIEHYAVLAAAHGFEQFCIGCELKGTTHRADDWRAVIADVRSRYAGPLTYASNHGDEGSITWWDALDFIGVDAYYELSRNFSPTLNELKAAWQPHIASLGSLSARWRKPILFTEIGYRSIDGTAMHPPDSHAAGNIDLQEQADCYEVVFESVYQRPWFAGMYWWSWGPNPLEGGPDEPGYSPHDKPAEEILRKWYEGSSLRTPRQIPEPDLSQKLDILSEGLDPGWEDQSWGAERDIAASDEFFHGTQSLRVKLDPDGAVSLGHPPFSSAPYYFLEFYIRGSSGDEPLLWVYGYDIDGKPLLRTPVNDQRYIDAGKIKAGKWSRVFIPLADMGVTRGQISRFSIQDRSGKGTTVFWIDDFWLLGANWEGVAAGPPKEAAIH